MFVHSKNDVNAAKERLDFIVNTDDNFRINFNFITTFNFTLPIASLHCELL